MSTRPTAALRAGDVVIQHAAINGHEVHLRVTGTPYLWVLSAGRHAGEVATDGPRQGAGRPLWHVPVETIDPCSDPDCHACIGQPVRTADHEWDLA